MAGYRVLDSSTARVEEFETEKGEYLTWLLRPQGRDYVNDAIGRTGRWEYELVALAMKLLPPNGQFLDIGAHLGAWALTIAKARPDARVDAYEPQSMVFYQLAANIFLNNLPNVRAHRVALGAAPGVGHLRLPDRKNLGSASLSQRGTDIESVTLTTLAELGVNGAHVIKLDVSGYEREVLEGGFQILRQRHPIIFFTSGDPRFRGRPARIAREALLAYFTKLDYQILLISGEDFIAFPEARHAEITALVTALSAAP
jgi:FkbM family methyltransferase